MLPDAGPRFEREYGCSEREWLSWMPAATHGRPWSQTGPDSMAVQVGEGQLLIGWQALPPRVIALLRVPRLLVRFDFQHVAEPERLAFQRAFDMRMQRGGG